MSEEVAGAQSPSVRDEAPRFRFAPRSAPPPEAGEGVELVVVRGDALELWALPSDAPRARLPLADPARAAEIALTRAPGGAYWNAHNRTECLLFDARLSLLARFAAPNFYNCAFLGEALFTYTSRDGDEYSTKLFRLRSDRVVPVDAAFVSRPGNAPAHFLALGDGLAAHISRPRQIDIYALCAGAVEFVESVQSEAPISDFAFGGARLFTVSSEAATAEVFERRNGTFTRRFHRLFNDVQELQIPISGPMLVRAHRFTDQSNKSYYGLEKLFRFDASKNCFAALPSHRGAIHDCQSNSAKTQFVAISGKMPAHAIVYDGECVPFYLLGHNYRNYVRYSPDDRLIALAGLGSLNGDIDVFCAESFALVGRAVSSHASFVKWSADSRFLITAIVARKLKVDHAIAVYTFDCKLLRRFKLSPFNLADADFLATPATPPLTIAALPPTAAAKGLLSLELEAAHALTKEEVERLVAANRVARPTAQSGTAEGEAAKDSQETVGDSLIKKKEKVLLRRKE